MGAAAPAASCFQLFGFDLMLDGDGRPWLLEVNGDPGLRTESPIFLTINAPMVADLLNLIGLAQPHLETKAEGEQEDEGDTASEVGGADARIRELRQEAARRHRDCGQEARGQWRRLHPSEHSEEWTRALSGE